MNDRWDESDREICDRLEKECIEKDARIQELEEEREYLLMRVIHIYTGEEEEMKEQRKIIEAGMRRALKERKT